MSYSPFADLAIELGNTRRVLERLPAEHFGWRPHPNSWTLAELATHVSRLPMWMQHTVAHDGIDVARLPPPGNPYTTTEAVLAAFDAASTGLAVAAGALTDDDLDAPWTLRRGEAVMRTMPRGQALRLTGVSHLIHHRAQLTVYLRLLDVPVPGLYGPSGDEQRGAG